MPSPGWNTAVTIQPVLPLLITVKFTSVKTKAKSPTLLADCNIKNLPGCTGIGHVRWATHGTVTRENAHPHCDASTEIAVIHNGIIENYEELKNRLAKKYKFQSDTDTEVIPHLIREQVDSGLNFEDAFFAAVRQLQGLLPLSLYPPLRTVNCSPPGKTARWFSALEKT